MRLFAPRLFLLLFFVSAAAAIPLSAARADVWRGTAPFCNGGCNPGERQIAVSNCGDGACCWTGHKTLCTNSTPLCQSKQTNTECFGVVEVCDNGYYEAPTQNWHSCNKYVCGICFGFSFESKKLFASAACKPGFVWREAVVGDTVCVTPATASEAAKDNAAAASRRSPNGGAFGPDTCKEGFVWREVSPSDHVCVTPQVRAAVATDNAATKQRIVSAQPYGPDSCKQGYVWREAVADDHVCVPPATRAEAAKDNAAAAARRSPNGGAFGPDTCKAGFVWREVILTDHVCVTPAVRAAAAADAIAASDRVAR